MNRLFFLAALMPFAVLAQPINTTNNPNQPGYVIPSQQRMQTEMNTQQQQQKGMLNQQRVLNGQPGEQVLPNTNGGMLSGSNSDRTLNSSQQHMLPQTQNGDLLSTPSNPQPLSR